jgi:YHS domain-containing protein
MQNIRFKLSAVILVLLICGPLQSAEKPLVNMDKKGVAIKGYDPVAYHTLGKPVPGTADYSLLWNEATWLFANGEHLAMFTSNPEKYAPAYGGYCAYAMASGRWVDIDPRAWKIVEGRLYLNFSLKVQKKWERDIPGYIRKADRQWAEILRKEKKRP